MRTCVIRQYYVPVDPRVRREIEALAAAGHEVDVICLAQPGERRFERRGPLRIFRVPLRHRRTGLAGAVAEHLAFVAAAGALAGVLHLRRRYDVVQANTVPDTVVFAALVPKLLGARVLLDLHECVPEFFATRFGMDPGHRAVRAAAAAEQAAIRFADRAITCTNEMRTAFVERGADPALIDVVLNSSDESVFSPRSLPDVARGDDGFRLILHGSVEERYGIDTAVEAVAALGNEIPGLVLEVYGEGSDRARVESLAQRLGLSEHVRFKGFVPQAQLLRGLAAADAGVVAMKRDAFRDLTHCNKMFELIAVERPVITSRTRSVEAYFGEDCFEFFDSGDPEDLARAIRALHADPERRRRLVARARQVAEPYRWRHQGARYVEIAEHLGRRERSHARPS